MYLIILLIGVIISPAFTRGAAVSRDNYQWKIFDGPCPSSEIETIAKFNQKQFTGVWYVIQRYEMGEYIDCTSAKYYWVDDRRQFSESLESQDLSSGICVASVDQLYEREPFANGGQFYVAPDDNNDYHFVDTDYNNYAVVWSCRNGYNLEYSYQNLMVLSKDRYFDVYSMESLNATLANPQFDRTKLQNMHHSDECRYPR